MKEILKKKTKNLAVWTFVWVFTFFIATEGPNEFWNNKIITVIALVVNLIIGIVMLISNKNLFDHYDEFQRKVQLEAMAFTLGLTVVIGLLFEETYKLGLITITPKIHHIIFFIGLTYIISVLLNSRRYK